MNTDIHFQISAPASLSIFGEYTKNKLIASIDLRTTLIFREVPASLSNNIEINFPRINLLHKIPLKIFSNFYNICVKNMELLHEIVFLFTFQYESINQKRFLQIFYYLIVFIMYKEQIEIKSFIILLTTQLISNGEFMSLTSLKVCLAACFLHWSHLQKGAHSTFNEADLKKICDYAMCCEKIDQSDLIDIMVCTYGSIMKEKEQNMHDEWFHNGLPSMTILLVDSNQTQDVKVQKQRIAELKNVSPDLVNSILNNLDAVTNEANDAFQTILDFFRNDKLHNKNKEICLLLQRKTLEICTRKSHRLLQKLKVSNIHLNKICKLAQRHGLSGKYTELGNGRYVYIWYTHTNLIYILMDELKTSGFDVMQTNLFCTGVKIG